MVSQHLRISRLFNQRIDEDITLLCAGLAPGSIRGLKRFFNDIVDISMNSPASAPHRRSVDQPVKVTHPRTIRQILLSSIESAAELRTSAYVGARVFVRHSLPKQHDQSSVECQLEEYGLHVGNSSGDYLAQHVLDTSLDVFEAVVAIRAKLRTQQASRVLPLLAFLREDAASKEITELRDSKAKIEV